jgi:hypothetical protein
MQPTIKEVVSVPNYLSRMPRRHMGEWKCSSYILDLGTRWRWVVSFKPRSPYPLGRRPRNPMYKWLGRPQSPSGRCGEQKNLAPVGNRIPAFLFLARRCTDWAIPTPYTVLDCNWNISMKFLLHKTRVNLLGDLIIAAAYPYSRCNVDQYNEALLYLSFSIYKPVGN